MMKEKIIYYCNDCKKKFVGLAGIKRCPFCDGENVEFIEKELQNKMMEAENGRDNMSKLQIKIKAY